MPRARANYNCHDITLHSTIPLLSYFHYFSNAQVLYSETPFIADEETSATERDYIQRYRSLCGIRLSTCTISNGLPKYYWLAEELSAVVSSYRTAPSGRHGLRPEHLVLGQVGTTALRASPSRRPFLPTSLTRSRTEGAEHACFPLLRFRPQARDESSCAAAQAAPARRSPDPEDAQAPVD